METNITLPRRAAGHKMTTKVPVATTDQKVFEIREEILSNIDEFETINYVYILSSQKHLKGVINLKSILAAKANRKITELMDTNIVKSHLNVDQERVAHLAVKNNIKAIPLLDKQERFVGVLPSDAILSILDHESKTDLLRLSGIIHSHAKLESGYSNIFKSFAYRAPWILIGLLGGMFTAKVIGLFDHVLKEEIILASFIPLVAYVANAVGAQTQTLYVREIAVNSRLKFASYAFQQFLISVLIGLSSWVALIVLALIFWDTAVLGILVGLSIFLAILTATFFALVVPYILEKFDIDPATGGGPFATVIQDLLSVLIYLTVASMAVGYF